jgi:hypothetical protein
LVAGLILVVSVMGTLLLLDTANSKGTNARAREGATNLGREVLEDAGGKTFSSIGSSGWLQAD